MNHGEIRGSGKKASEPQPLCAHRPEDGTLYTTTGLPASLTWRSDFPVDAVCAECRQPIRREQFEVTDPAGDWQLKYPVQARLAALKKRHPEINVSENGQSASWFDDDGSHVISYESPLRMAEYLESRFDR